MSAHTEQRKLAAIMFTDMVGYSALSQRNEALALELLEEHRRVVRGLLPRHGGREVKTTGDGFLLEFPSALAAVQGAVEIQNALHERNQISPPERQLRIRIGIHVGDVVMKDGDIHGDGVNIAARIEPLAAAGGICISSAVQEQVRNKLAQPMAALGPAELKNIELPVVVHRVVMPWESVGKGEGKGARSEVGNKNQSRVTSAATKWGAIAALLLLAVWGWWFVHRSSQETKSIAQSSTNSATSPTTPSAPAAPDQKSIAVLAFVNMSADKENEYFSDGITEEILNALARTPGLRVAARTSAFSFKGKNESVQRIGELLKVGVVLEGSVRKAGNQLRITAQLINVADGFHLWSDTFDRKAEDVFAIQTEVAQKVTEVLKVKLLAGGSPNTTLAGTDNLEAYDLYLRGRELWNKRTGADLQRAVGLFQQATEKDPKFAAAYAALATSYALLPVYAAEPASRTNPKVRAAARRALELDARLAEARVALGRCYLNDRDWASAEREFREAVRMNANYALSHQWLGDLLVVQEKNDEALTEIRKAEALDPLSAVIPKVIGDCLYAAARFDEAMVECEKALKLAPDFLPAFMLRAQVFLAQNKIPEAIAELEKVRAKTGDTPYALGYLGNAFARAGRTNEARQILGKLKSVSASGGAASWEITLVNLGLEDLDQVFIWLERGTENRDVDPRWWKTDPLFHDAVKDPRYAALLKKYGLDK